MRCCLISSETYKLISQKQALTTDRIRSKVKLTFGQSQALVSLPGRGRVRSRFRTYCAGCLLVDPTDRVDLLIESAALERWTSGVQRFHQSAGSHDLHHALQVIG